MNHKVIVGSLCLFLGIVGLTVGEYCDAGHGCEIDCEFGCGAFYSYSKDDPDNGTCHTCCTDEDGNERDSFRQERAMSSSQSVGSIIAGNINTSLRNIALPQLALTINEISPLSARYNGSQPNATVSIDLNNTTLMELLNSTGLELAK